MSTMRSGRLPRSGARALLSRAMRRAVVLLAMVAACGAPRPSPRGNGVAYWEVQEEGPPATAPTTRVDFVTFPEGAMVKVETTIVEDDDPVALGERRKRPLRVQLTVEDNPGEWELRGDPMTRDPAPLL